MKADTGEGVDFDRATSREALYVGMTRGRESNRVWIDRDDGAAWREDVDLPPPEAALAGIIGQRRVGRSAHAAIQATDSGESLSRPDVERPTMVR